eukprot:611455-Rhodomonas_salina.1
MQDLLVILSTFCDWSGMEINLSKTVLTAYDFGTRSTPTDTALITYKGERLRSIPHTDSYPYLGFDISLSGDWSKEFDK